MAESIECDRWIAWTAHLKMKMEEAGAFMSREDCLLQKTQFAARSIYTGNHTSDLLR